MATTTSYNESVDNKYITRLGSMPREFESLQELLTASFEDTRINKEAGMTAADIASAIVDATPPQFTGTRNRDTSIGGNDAVNCFYQFNENDDIIPKISQIDKQHNKGLGRVYGEVFNDQQQYLHISFGVADFTSIKKFYEAMIDADLAKLMNTGKHSAVATLASLVTKALFIPIALPWIAGKWAIDILSSPGITSPSKYYDFRPTMSVYYKMVNVILAHLAVNLGITVSDNVKDVSYEGVPDILKKHGLDILTILGRRHRWDDNDFKPITTDEYFNLSQDNYDEETSFIGEAVEGAVNFAGGVIENFLVGAKYGENEALKYVSFRIEKGSDANESASNSTKESSLSQTINSAIHASKDVQFKIGGLKSMGALGTALSTVGDALTGVLNGITGSLGITGGAELLTGSGLIDIPEVYDSSTFSKSYSFDFQLRTPFADKVSIFYSLYTPLALLIAGAFPRAVGPNAYTSPFLVRAYAKGQFAIPLGIIDSITITRGAAEYGWSTDMLPTCLDITFTIKDLSPITMVGLADGKILSWKNIMGQNSSFQEYMLTLGGTGLAERTLAFDLIGKRSRVLMKIASNNKFNPRMIGMSLASSTVGQLASAFVPTRLSGD